MNKSTRYSPEVRERAVRLVFEHEREYSSQWSAIKSIAGRLGCSAETLRKWVRRTETDAGRREGLTTENRERIKSLEQEVRALRRANEILKTALAFFAQARSDQPGYTDRPSRLSGDGFDCPIRHRPVRLRLTANRDYPVTGYVVGLADATGAILVPGS